MNLDQLSTDRLQTALALARTTVRQLEQKGHFRTAEENALLKQQRAVVRRVGAEMRRRIRQLPLF